MAVAPPRIDEYTDKLGLPLPNVANNADTDCERIAGALALLDAWAADGGSIVYVDNAAALPVAGADNTLYVAKGEARFYRWDGAAYVIVGSPESTDVVPEGAANKYFTDARARAAAGLATASVPGLVRVGSGLSVGLDGQLSVVGAAGAGGVPAFNELVMVPTANGQKNFTPNGGYTAGMIELFLNGVLLYGNADDYTATNGTTITLTAGVNTTDTLLLRRWTTSNNFPFSALTDKPVTIAGYGIADNTFANLKSKPTTLGGYGITDALLASNFTFANLGGKPTTLSGYGIADGVAKSFTLGNNVNLNWVTESGFYRISVGTVNGPPGIDLDYGQIIVSRGGDTMIQIAANHNNGLIFFRQAYGIGGGNPVFGVWRPMGNQPVRYVDDTGGYMYGESKGGLNTVNVIRYSSGACNKYMPINPTLGDTCTVIVGNGRTDTTLFVNPVDGIQIMGLSENFTIDNNAAAVTFVYAAHTGWRLI